LLNSKNSYPSYFRSPEKFDKLITSLRTAVDNDGTLDKEGTSYNDIFDRHSHPSINQTKLSQVKDLRSY
ncbi:MAG: hypothetical protein ACJ71O_11015, partial [Nitrososphaeraceae archaeon]